MEILQKAELKQYHVIKFIASIVLKFSDWTEKKILEINQECFSLQNSARCTIVKITYNSGVNTLTFIWDNHSHPEGFSPSLIVILFKQATCFVQINLYFISFVTVNSTALSNNVFQAASTCRLISMGMRQDGLICFLILILLELLLLLLFRCKQDSSPSLDSLYSRRPQCPRRIFRRIRDEVIKVIVKVCLPSWGF